MISKLVEFFNDMEQSYDIFNLSGLSTELEAKR
jgi:hypothetical protein